MLLNIFAIEKAREKGLEPGSAKGAGTEICEAFSLLWVQRRLEITSGLAVHGTNTNILDQLIQSAFHPTKTFEKVQKFPGKFPESPETVKFLKCEPFHRKF